MLFAKRQLQTTNWKSTKINCNTTGGAPSQVGHFQELEPCFAFLVNPFIVNVVSYGFPVRQTFVTNLSAVETNLTVSKKIFLNATLQLISGHRFQKILRIEKTSAQLISVHSTTNCCDLFFSVMKFLKSNHRAILKMNN